MIVMLVVLVVLCLPIVSAQNKDSAIQDKIESAMSAGPIAIAKDATILDNDMDANGEFIVLRKGTNGWYCMPDLLSTPTNDPACNDQVWQDWTHALFTGEKPNVTVPGIAYMLQGGSEASITDPLATEPVPGEDWVTSPPHIMLLFPGKLDTTRLSTDATYGGPYAMWAGTPYEHIMVPVAEAKN